MRMLMNIRFPHERFNELVREGTAKDKLKSILADIKPEAVYFTEQDGERGAVVIVNVDEASQIPALAEPWFLTFEADVELRIAMTPEDLDRADLNELSKKWA